MLVSQHLGADRQGLQIKGLGGRRVACRVVQGPQVVQAVGNVGVLLTQDPAPDGQCLFIKRYCRPIVAGGTMEQRKVVQDSGKR